MSRMRHDDLRELAVEIDLVRRSRDGETRDRSSSAVTAETLSAVAEILGMDAKP